MPVVMDADRIGRTLTRIAHEIVERNKGTDDLALVGVRTRGVPIARRIARTLREITGHDIPTGSLDITLYRDDTMRSAVGPQPLVRKTDIQFSIDNRKILLVDSSKFGKVALNVLGDLSAFDVVLTTDRVDEAVRARLKEAGVKLEIVKAGRNT